MIERSRVSVGGRGEETQEVRRRWGREIGQTSRDQFAPVRAPDSDPDSIARQRAHA